MNFCFSRCGFVALGLFINTLQSHASDTGFAYQGRLDRNGLPVDGRFDFQFTLHATSTGEDPSSPSVTVTNVGVANGLFYVDLDFDRIEPLHLVGRIGSFDGKERWLSVAARPSGDEPFVRLSPRQPIAPSPSAVMAGATLSVPGVSANALHSPNEAGRDVVFVDRVGAVGVGTTNPVSKLHLVSERTGESAPQVRSTEPAGFSAGWDFYHQEVGKGYIGVPGLGASFAPGEFLLFGATGRPGAPGTPVSLWAGGTRALTASTGGTVGIGTPYPVAMLEVHGDLRLGQSGEFQSAGADEPLRIVRGSFNPDTSIVSGQGFSVTFPTNEFADYVIHFTTPFSGRPTVTASAGTASLMLANLMVFESTPTGVTLRPFSTFFWHQLKSPIHFIAVGPR